MSNTCHKTGRHAQPDPPAGKVTVARAGGRADGRDRRGGEGGLLALAVGTSMQVMVPKSRDGAAESIRALRVARAGAAGARTQAGNQLRDLILTAPGPLRQQLAGLPSRRQAGLAARFRPGGPTCPAEGTKAAMTSVARRHQQLTAEITRLDTMLDELVRHAFPEGFLAKQALTTAGVATRLGGSNRLIGVRETAARLDVPVSTLYKHWREWQLTAYRVGRALKFRERDIEVWLERQRVDGIA